MTVTKLNETLLGIVLILGIIALGLVVADFML